MASFGTVRCWRCGALFHNSFTDFDGNTVTKEHPGCDCETPPHLLRLFGGDQPSSSDASDASEEASQ